MTGTIQRLEAHPEHPHRHYGDRITADQRNNDNHDHLHKESDSPRRYEQAALRYLERYITEEKPSLVNVAGVVGLLAERALLMRWAFLTPR